MVTGTRVYLARIAGLPVFDPNGDPVGRLRDIVVALRTDDQPPPVLGLVLEISHRRRIFVPIGRLTSIDATALVLGTGTVNLRRFERRPQETLVIAELLDRGVTVRQTDAAATLVDVAMEPSRTRGWALTRVAVRGPVGRHLPRRRGHLRQLEWNEVAGLSQSPQQQGTGRLLESLEGLRAADVAATFRDLRLKRRREVAEALDDDRLADVLEEMTEADQIQILSELAEGRAADVLEAMDPDDAADLLRWLPASERERLLGLMEPQEAEPVRQLLVYPDDTAGGLMTSEPIILTPDATIAEALAHVRRNELTPALASQVFVCRPPAATPTGRFLGVAHFQRLLREPPFDLVGGVVDDDLEPLRPETPLGDVTRYFATYNLVAAPVVDRLHRLIGAVTVDDVLDHQLPENWREQDRDQDRDLDRERDRESDGDTDGDTDGEPDGASDRGHDDV